MTIGVIRTIAVSVFRESVRDKVLYNLVFFAVLLIAVSYLLSQLTAGQDMKVIKDLGLAAMSLFGLFIAVFIGIGLVSKEVEKRSIYALLAKPIRRQEFVVGKYLGLVLTLFVNLAIMAVAYYAVLGAVAWIDGAWFRPHWEAPAVDPALLKAIAMIFLQLAIVVAIALFFSTFSSPMLAAALTFGLYVVGHFNADLKNFETVIDSKPVAYLARALYYLLPNLAPLDVKSDVVHARARARDVSPAERGVQRRVRGDPRVGCDVHLHAAGFQMTPRRQTGAFIASLIAMLAVAVALQVVRDRAFAYAAVDKQVLYVSNPEVMRRAALSYDTLLADVYWIRALQHYGGERQKPRSRAALRSAVSAARSGDDARSALHHRVSVRGDLSGRAAPGRGRPARSGDRALEERDRVQSRQVGLLPRHRIHLLLEPSRLPAGGRLVRAAAAICPARRSG